MKNVSETALVTGRLALTGQAIEKSGYDFEPRSMTQSELTVTVSELFKAAKKQNYAFQITVKPTIKEDE